MQCASPPPPDHPQALRRDMWRASTTRAARERDSGYATCCRVIDGGVWGHYGLRVVYTVRYGTVTPTPSTEHRARPDTHTASMSVHDWSQSAQRDY